LGLSVPETDQTDLNLGVIGSSAISALIDAKGRIVWSYNVR